MLDALTFADASVAFDSKFLISWVARIVHTSCAAIMLGGSIYLRCVLAPAIEDPTDAEGVERTLFAGRRGAWAGLVGAASGLLLISGLGYYMLMVIAHESMDGKYHMFVGIKILLALVVIAMMSLIGGRTAAAVKIRAGAKGYLNVAIAATLAIFLLAGAAKTFPHIPKPAADAPAEASPNDTADN